MSKREFVVQFRTVTQHPQGDHKAYLGHDINRKIAASTPHEAVTAIFPHARYWYKLTFCLWVFYDDQFERIYCHEIN